jgi:hypothetical protein
MNNQNTPEILLDTSFLLPTLGFNVDNQLVYDALKKIADSTIDVHYSDINLLECSWQAASAIKRNEFDAGTYRTGLRSIAKSERYRIVRITNEAYVNAVHLYELGNQDMMDNLLYSIAYSFQMRFLTLDLPFIQFLIDNNLPNVTITASEIPLF